MASGRSRPSPSAELTQRLDGFDRFCLALVRLEPYPLEEVRATVVRFASALARHLATQTTGSSPAPGELAPDRGRIGRLAAEHERFHASLEQLRVLLEVVVRDDHGGHRQALGQYGRIVVEALRSHLADELGGDPLSRSPTSADPVASRPRQS